MTTDWNLRAELLEATHRWPLILIFILLGSLIGVGVTYLLPTSYQAEAELHVSYNADIFPRNPDDYKNWQMEELDVFVISPSLLADTLERLRSQDPAWQSISSQQLGSMTRVYWRNAGSWRLVADADSPARAVQLASTWQKVVLEHFAEVLLHARATLDIDRQIRAIAAQQVDVRARATELALVEAALQDWKSALRQGASSQSALGQPLDTRQRWDLLALAARAASPYFTGQVLFQELPPANAPASDYLPWSDQALVALRREQELLGGQSADLAARSDALGLQWNVEIEASRGLTANLRVEALPAVDPQAQPLRPLSSLALVGGISGLILWGLLWLARPFIKAKV